MFISSILVAGNWLIYIWAVNNGYVLQASLGYYINPLVNVALGIIFLKERLRRMQFVAVIIASAGVVYLSISLGRFPWIAMTLAFSFGCYGLIRKVATIGSLVGLSVETMLLSIPALLYLAYLHINEAGIFLRESIRLDCLLAGSSLVTAVPLLFFTLGARRLNLSTVGFLQYIAPTSMFLLGVFLFHEPFAVTQLVTFLLIWSALAIYSVDSYRFYKANSHQNHS